MVGSDRSGRYGYAGVPHFGCQLFNDVLCLLCCVAVRARGLTPDLRNLSYEPLTMSHIYVYIYLYTYEYVYMYMYMHTYIYVYVYTCKEIERERERQRASSVVSSHDTTETG